MSLESFEKRYAELLEKSGDIIWFKRGNYSRSTITTVKINGKDYECRAFFQAIIEGDIEFVNQVIVTVEEIPWFFIRCAAENDQLEILKLILAMYNAEGKEVAEIDIYYTLETILEKDMKNMYFIWVILLNKFKHLFKDSNGFNLNAIERIAIKAIECKKIDCASFIYRNLPVILFSSNGIFEALINNGFSSIDNMKNFFTTKMDYRHQIWYAIRRDILDMFKYFVDINKDYGSAEKDRVTFLLGYNDKISIELISAVAIFMYEIKSNKANTIMKYLLQYRGILMLFLKEELIMKEKGQYYWIDKIY
jgi:hypothetical protein